MNQEFAENIKNHIREYLPVDYQDAKITLEKVTKGNDRILTGLIIRKDDETAAPSIYLEHYEEQFGKGRPMDDIMKEIAQIKMENSLELPIDVKGLQDYETARPLLAIRLCDPEKNQEYVPFPVSWTVKMKKKQKETQDILSYHTQAAGCSDKARAKASGGRQPIEECGRTGL